MDETTEKPKKELSPEELSKRIDFINGSIHTDVKFYWDFSFKPIPYVILSRRYSKTIVKYGYNPSEFISKVPHTKMFTTTSGKRFLFPEAEFNLLTLNERYSMCSDKDFIESKSASESRTKFFTDLKD